MWGPIPTERADQGHPHRRDHRAEVYYPVTVLCASVPTDQRRSSHLHATTHTAVEVRASL